MGKLKPEDLRLENGVLYVRLPPSEIFFATLDNDKSYVYDRETGVLTRPTVDLETTARQVAEDEIRKAAEEDGILELAQQNAETYLAKFFGALGYSNTISALAGLISPLASPHPIIRSQSASVRPPHGEQ